MTHLPDLGHMSQGENNAVIRALWSQVQAVMAGIAVLEVKLSSRQNPLCCGGITQAPIPTGLHETSPLKVSIVALSVDLRDRLPPFEPWFIHLCALQIGERALRRAQRCFDDEVAVILAPRRRSRIVCSDEATLGIDGQTHADSVFQNDHVVRKTRAAGVVTETMAAHRPTILSNITLNGTVEVTRLHCKTHR